MNETKITLKFPITANGKVLSEVALRRPTVADRLASQKAASDDAEREVYLTALLTGLAPEDVHKMDLADYLRISAEVEGFLSPDRKSSGKR
jgi:hypothetical protein